MLILGEKIDTSYANFGSMLRKKCLLVDKTRMIKDFWYGKDVSLIIRPRRFGKTWTMSMLQHFFSADVNRIPTQGLFDNLAISNDDNGEFVRKHQGKYPVIFLTFKDIKAASYQSTVHLIKLLMQELYSEHETCLYSEKINLIDKKRFEHYLAGTSSSDEVPKGLKFLSEILYKVYNKKTVVLLDEYDTPLTHAYQSDFLEPLSLFMRELFSSAFKDNDFLEKGLMTGILRVSRNNMLSGLNNLEMYTLMDNQYSQYFGFTDIEVAELIEVAGVKDHWDEIKQFYNGYNMGGTVIYNPWSLMHYLDKKELSPYWVLTANDDLLKKMMLESDEKTREQLNDLMQGKIITATIDLYLRYENVLKDATSFWTLLLFCGYLTVISKTQKNLKYLCQLRVPNQEVLAQYKDIFTEWLANGLGEHQYHAFLKSLVSGNVEKFTQILGHYLLDSLSFRDVVGKKAENFYHGFVAGIIASIRDTHWVDSNKESGLGLYDIILTPKDACHSVSLILEFKHAKTANMLKRKAKQAVNQMNEKNYSVVLERYPHIQKILKVGLSFCEKTVISAYQEENIITHECGELLLTSVTQHRHYLVE